jgi:hypothetical protein
MNKRLWLLLIILSLCFTSCENDFNINAPYEDVYVLNCILRSDQSIQYALVSKNYFTENGAAPAVNSIDKNIKGVTIKIYHNDSMFVMRDTTFQLTDSGDETRINCYYVKNLILHSGKYISIEASVPNGKILKSAIQVPQISFANLSFNFPQVLTNLYGSYSVVPYFEWSWIGNATVLNLPQLEVYYKKNEQGTWNDKKVFVPLALNYYLDEKGNLIPEIVRISFNYYCQTTLETINKTMQDISGNDPNKKNYIITKAVFSVLGLDPVLSRYYSASTTYATEFTIKLRQTEISNIEGGKGIFGEYYKYSQSLMVDSIYVESFGYQYDPM